MNIVVLIWDNTDIHNCNQSLAEQPLVVYIILVVLHIESTFSTTKGDMLVAWTSYIESKLYTKIETTIAIARYNFHDLVLLGQVKLVLQLSFPL